MANFFIKYFPMDGKNWILFIHCFNYFVYMSKFNSWWFLGYLP